MNGTNDSIDPLPGTPRSRKLILLGLGLWLAFQVLMPIRHHLYPGDTSWTEQGHRFAWQMKLRDKDARAHFIVTDPDTGRQWLVNNRQFLTRRQVFKMSDRPDMILQFAHFLADRWRRVEGVAEPEVRAFVIASLNGREPAMLIDPTRDLAKVERNLWPADWILPLYVPLNPERR